MQPNLTMVLEQVGKDKGIDVKILLGTLEQAILTAAKKVFGLHRELEAQYNEDIGAVDLFQICYVVEGPEAQAGREITKEQSVVHGLEAEIGDELLFQIFYRSEDFEKARIRTRHPVGENRRNFSGRLLSVDAGKVRIDVGDQVCEVPVDDVEKANLVYEF